jgi:hypothetical protein
MRHVLAILFGAGFTISISAAAGSLVLRRLRVALYRGEAVLFGFLAGASVVSMAVFFLCLVGEARWPVFLSVGIGAIGWAWWPRPATRPKCPPLPKYEHKNYIYYLLFTLFLLIYFINSLAPEISPDGSGYHLGNVARMWRQNGFVWDYHSMYSYLSQGLEMLFLVAFSFGRHSAAALVHLTFLIVLALLIVCYGRRFGFPAAGWFAAILVFASPVVGKAGSSAYNDLAAAALIFAVFYLLQIWNEDRSINLLMISGLLAGFCYGVKYPAGVSLLFAIGFVWRFSESPGRRRDLAILLSAAAVGILPWVLRNWIWIGNPFAPFANRWFPNPSFHPGMEAMYLADLGHYSGIRHRWQIPWELLVRGRATAGLLGPLFVLAPVALFALRQRAGRRLLLAAAVFAIPAWFNTGARFLIPVLPFAGLAMGLALTRFRAVLAVIAVMQGIAGLPSVSARYADRAAWRVTSIPLSAALRLQPESRYLNDHLKDYSMKAALETLTPPRAGTFSLNAVSEAYFNRNFVVGYESALGNRAMDLLAAPLDRNVRPSERQHFRFLPVTTQAVRIVETANSAGFWSIAEMRVYSQSREVPRSKSWRIKAWPNGWDAQFAFDNSYATRWSSWQTMSYGMYLAIDFGKPEVIDEVVLDHAPEPEAKVQVEVMDSRSRWIPLTDSSQTEQLETPYGLRRSAALALRQSGIHYLFVRDTDFFAEDMKRNARYWGVTELHRTEQASLYLIN